MIPRHFRDLTKADQVEMMAHRREFHLRESHAHAVGKIVSGLEEKKA